MLLAARASTVTTTGALVALPDRNAPNPTPPAACSAAVESVALTCHAPGSAPDAGQTLAWTVVGEVPSTCSRTFSTVPGAYVRPGTVTSEVSAVSAFAESVRLARRTTALDGRSRIRAR